MHAEEEAGSHFEIATAYGLSLKVRQGFAEDKAIELKAAFERFAPKFYAAYQKELLRRIAQSLGVPQKVLDRKASNVDGADHVRQAEPKRRARRRRARRR